jgi:hypothetical protein
MLTSRTPFGYFVIYGVSELERPRRPWTRKPFCPSHGIPIECAGQSGTLLSHSFVVMTTLCTRDRAKDDDVAHCMVPFGSQAFGSCRLFWEGPFIGQVDWWRSFGDCCWLNPLNIRRAVYHIAYVLWLLIRQSNAHWWNYAKTSSGFYSIERCIYRSRTHKLPMLSLYLFFILEVRVTDWYYPCFHSRFGRKLDLVFWVISPRWNNGCSFVA